VSRKRSKVVRLSPRRALDTVTTLRRVLHRIVDAAIAADDALREADAAALVRALDALRANVDRANFLAAALIGGAAPA
jgi:hypothetical protein